MTAPVEKYPALLYPQTVIANNKSFCFANMIEQNEQLAVQSASDKHVGSLPANFTLYSAIWHSHLLQPVGRPMDSFKLFGKGIYHSWYDYHKAIGLLKADLASNEAATIVPAVARVGPEVYSDRYIYDIVYFEGSKGTSSKNSTSGQRLDLQSFLGNATMILEEPNKVNPPVIYHLVGASNCRYIFDSLIEFLTGPETLVAEHKHYAMTFRQSLDFAYAQQVDDAADEVQRVCTNAAAAAAKNKGGTQQKHKIVFHTGVSYHKYDLF